MTLAILAGPPAAAVVISGWMLLRARVGSTRWLISKTGDPAAEADEMERFLHPYRYR